VSVYKEVTVHMNKLQPKGHAPLYVMLTAIILTTMLTAVQMDEIAWEKTPIDEEASIHNSFQVIFGILGENDIMYGLHHDIIYRR